MLTKMTKESTREHHHDCIFCPCEFESEKDIKSHLKAFGNHPEIHRALFYFLHHPEWYYEFERRFINLRSGDR